MGKNQNLVNAWQNTLIYDMFKQQTHKDSIFYNNELKVWFGIDELNSLDAKMVVKLVREGRPRNIGTFFADQTPKKIDAQIWQNTKYCMCLQMDVDEQINYVLDKFEIPKSYGQAIKQLDKTKFECFVFANENLIVIDPAKGEIFKTKEPQRGIMLPPRSNPKLPGKFEVGIKHSLIGEGNISSNQKEEVYTMRLMNRNTKGKTVKSLGPHARVHKRRYSLVDNQTDYLKTVFRDINTIRLNITYNELMNMGYMIVSIPFELSNYKSKKRFYPGQSVVYQIIKKDQPIPGKFTKHIHKPNEINEIIFDPINDRLRIYGKSCGPLGMSRWLYVE